MQSRIMAAFKSRYPIDAHRRVYVLLVFASLLVSAPLFRSLDRMGRRDWDQLTFRYDAPRVALLRDHQVPLWNPYVNGGNVLLAHPASPFPSPWYLPVLVLGASQGLRVQVALFVAIGAVGAAALLRKLNATPAGSFVGGVLFMMSAHFSLHIAEGHLEWCVLGLMPWVTLCLLRAEDDRRYVIMGALLLSSALLFGSVYIMAVYLPFLSLWALLESLRRRSWRMLLAWTSAVVVMVLLSAVKLLPQVDFAERNPRPRKIATEGLSPGGLAAAFLEAGQARLYWAMRDVESEHQAQERGVANANVPSVPVEEARSLHARLRALGVVDEWHEYGAYITYLGLALAMCGVVVSWRTQWPLYAAGGVAVVVMLSSAAPFDLWSLLQQLPLYRSLTVPSRFVAVVVLVLALAAGLGLSWLERLTAVRRSKASSLLVYVVPLAIYAELALLAWRLWGNIFVYPAAPLPAHETFATRYGRLDTNYPGMYSFTQPLLIANSGTLEGYENLQVARGRVKLESDSGYRGEAYLEGVESQVRIRSWSMSSVTADFAVHTASTLVLNQNYDVGWRARIQGAGGVRDQVASANANGLVSVAVYDGDREATVFYRPDTFVKGAWVSAFSWLGCLALLIPFGRRRFAEGTLSRNEEPDV